MTDLQSLKKSLYSQEWKESLEAADKLAEVQSNEAIKVLVEALMSDDNFVRNAASLGIREANNPSASTALFKRIKELGTNEEIGTMVYSLETADCSRNLLDIINLYFEGNYEVKVSAKTILEEQVFVLTYDELEAVKQRLKKEGATIEDFKIKFTTNEA